MSMKVRAAQAPGAAPPPPAALGKARNPHPPRPAAPPLTAPGAGPPRTAAMRNAGTHPSARFAITSFIPGGQRQKLAPQKRKPSASQVSFTELGGGGSE